MKAAPNYTSRPICDTIYACGGAAAAASLHHSSQKGEGCLNKSPVRRLFCAMAVMLMLLSFSTSLASSDEYNSLHPENLKSNQISGQSAIVIDASTGDVLFEKNADDKRFPASTTKILTTYIALQVTKPDDIATVYPSALFWPEYDGSVIGLVAGEQISMDDLIKATMVFSGNDGANVIAEHISGSQEAFAQLMNQTARQLGATNSNFVNAHGYHDENQYSTARDLAIITMAAMEDPEFRDIARLTTYSLPANEWRSKAVRKTSDDDVLMNSGREEGQYYYQYAIGVKTGYHSLAGRCFVGAAEKDGIELISVTLQSSSRGRWTDTRRLMDYGFSRYISTSIEALYRENPKVVDISSYRLDDPGLGQLELSLRKREPLANDTLVGYVGQTTNWQRIFNARTNVSLDRVLVAPITAGEIIGTLTYTPEGADAVPVEYDLIAARSIERRTAAAPSVAEIIQYSDNDPNPFPRFSFEFAFIVATPVITVILISQILYRLITRRKKPKYKKNTGYKTRYYR